MRSARRVLCEAAIRDYWPTDSIENDRSMATSRRWRIAGEERRRVGDEMANRGGDVDV